MEFTVKRSIWLRGEGQDNSFLLRQADGKKCCLGFLANACGYDDLQILQHRTFQTLSDYLDKIPNDIVNRRADIEFINDQDLICVTGPAKDREQRLIECFQKCGITVHFED